jgi:hypothetical protein
LLFNPAAMPLVLLQLPPEDEVDPLPSVKVVIVSDKSRAINNKRMCVRDYFLSP